MAATLSTRDISPVPRGANPPRCSHDRRPEFMGTLLAKIRQVARRLPRACGRSNRVLASRLIIRGGREHMIIRPFVIAGLTCAAAAATATAAQDKPAAAATPAAKRNLQVDDLFRIKTVADPQLSHDSRWVAYTVQTSNLKEDKSETQVWMASTDGGEPLPMTAKGTSASRPRFS